MNATPPTVERACEMLRMALAEAGFPHVRVTVGPCSVCGRPRVGVVGHGISEAAKAAAVKACNIIWPSIPTTNLFRPGELKRCRCVERFCYERAS